MIFLHRHDNDIWKALIICSYYEIYTHTVDLISGFYWLAMIVVNKKKKWNGILCGAEATM